MIAITSSKPRAYGVSLQERVATVPVPGILAYLSDPTPSLLLQCWPSYTATTTIVEDELIAGCTADSQSTMDYFHNNCIDYDMYTTLSMTNSWGPMTTVCTDDKWRWCKAWALSSPDLTLFNCDPTNTIVNFLWPSQWFETYGDSITDSSKGIDVPNTMSETVGIETETPSPTSSQTNSLPPPSSSSFLPSRQTSPSDSQNRTSIATPLPTTRSRTTNLALIISLTVGLTLVSGILLIVSCICIRKRRSKAAAAAAKVTETAPRLDKKEVGTFAKPELPSPDYISHNRVNELDGREVSSPIQAMEISYSTTQSAVGRVGELTCTK